jgi:hypothetical protein
LIVEAAMVLICLAHLIAGMLIRLLASSRPIVVALIILRRFLHAIPIPLREIPSRILLLLIWPQLTTIERSRRKSTRRPPWGKVRPRLVLRTPPPPTSTPVRRHGRCQTSTRRKTLTISVRHPSLGRRLHGSKDGWSDLLVDEDNPRIPRRSPFIPYMLVA